VRAAIEGGWDPESRGRAVRLQLDDDQDYRATAYATRDSGRAARGRSVLFRAWLSIHKTSGLSGRSATTRLL
ncbi:MAG: hypothetical protein ABW221_05545, partial [Vicinamibacteria bacterium]